MGATAEANLRVRVLACAISAQPLIGLMTQIVGWHSGLGTVEWNSPPPALPIGGNSTPETHAGLLITYLASYRSISGT
jgi:hypothetical protein